MASEFSRELGEKVVRGKTRLAHMDFWMGGPPGYGYRRRMVSSGGENLSRFSSCFGHASVQTTERYLGCKQRLSLAVNDTLRLEDT